MDIKKQLDTTHVINNIEQQLLSVLNKYKRHHVNVSNVFELYRIKLVTWCSNFEFPALEVNLEMESDLVQVALSVLFRLISFHF